MMLKSTTIFFNWQNKPLKIADLFELVPLESDSHRMASGCVRRRKGFSGGEDSQGEEPIDFRDGFNLKRRSNTYAYLNYLQDLVFLSWCDCFDS